MDSNNKSSKSRWIGLGILLIMVVIITVIAVWMPDLGLSIWVYIQPWLWWIITIIGILVLYKLIIYAINRYVHKIEKFPKDAANGLIILVRVIVIFAIIFVFLPALNIPAQYVLNVSTVLATALGIASTIAVSNIVAGFFMITSRPYKIGDYVSVDGAMEGVVDEVGLNYTKIVDSDNTVYRIPNNTLFSSNLVNFSLEPVKQKKKAKLIHDKVVSVLSDAMIDKNIERYVFELDLTFDPDPQEVIATLDQICDRWEKKLGYRPQYFFNGLAYRATIKWALLTDGPKVIMNNKSLFLEDLWRSIYKLNKEEAK